MDLDAALPTLARDPSAPFDLAELTLHLARDEYPLLDVDAVLHELSGMAHEARAYIRGTPLQQVQGLCRYLFHDMGFHGNTGDYFDPRNSYLNVVLERRTGIPISLATVVRAVGTRAGLHVEGVGLPGHFICKVPAEPEDILIDAFHGGRLISRTDCENLVLQATGVPFEASPLALQALPLGLTVQRMLANLRGIYIKRSDWPRAIRVLRRLTQLAPHDVVLRRDLGIAFVHHNQPGLAIDHLQAYLEAAVEADDLKAVEAFLEAAWKSVAQGN